jgi:hypothetical protein
LAFVFTAEPALFVGGATLLTGTDLAGDVAFAGTAALAAGTAFLAADGALAWASSGDATAFLGASLTGFSVAEARLVAGLLAALVAAFVVGVGMDFLGILS